MAIVTVAAQNSEPLLAVPPGNRRRVAALLTGDAAYSSGGSTIAAALFGLSAIDAISVGLNVAGTNLYVWDSVNKKLKGFSALGVELSGDDSASKIPVVVWGI